MFDLVHAMRTRIMTSPVFTGERILAAILFEQTMDRQVEGLGSAEYLWTRKHVVPFLKVDLGLAEEAHGVKTMKPMPGLDALLERAEQHGVFGTKMRSVILTADRGWRGCRCRTAVPHRAAHPGGRSGADRRTRGRHPQRRQGGCRGAPARRAAALHSTPSTRGRTCCSS